MRPSEPRWRHPELQPGWIDRPHRKVELGDFTLERGEVVRNFEISYVAHGTLAPAADNAILVLTAIGSIHRRPDFLIGPGWPLDPERHFIICADAIRHAGHAVAADSSPETQMSAGPSPSS